MADRDPEALEREIERTRQELARTIDELAERVNPRNLAHKGTERIKEEAGQLVQAVNAIVRPEGEDGEPERRTTLHDGGPFRGRTTSARPVPPDTA